MRLAHSATDLRIWAMECFEQANDPRASGDERARLMRMHEGLLALANGEDWLAGRGETGQQGRRRAGRPAL